MAAGRGGRLARRATPMRERQEGRRASRRRQRTGTGGAAWAQGEQRCSASSATGGALGPPRRAAPLVCHAAAGGCLGKKRRGWSACRARSPASWAAGGGAFGAPRRAMPLPQTPRAHPGAPWGSMPGQGGAGVATAGTALRSFRALLAGGGKLAYPGRWGARGDKRESQRRALRARPLRLPVAQEPRDPVQPAQARRQGLQDPVRRALQLRHLRQLHL